MHRCASLLAGVLCPAVFPDGFRLPDMCRIGKHNCVQAVRCSRCILKRFSVREPTVSHGRLLFSFFLPVSSRFPCIFQRKRSLIAFRKFMMRQRICFRITDHIKIGNIRFRNTAATTTVNIALRYESSAVFTVFVSRHHVSFLLYFFCNPLQSETILISLPICFRGFRTDRKVLPKAPMPR